MSVKTTVIEIPPCIFFSCDKKGRPTSCCVEDRSKRAVLVKETEKEQIEQKYYEIFLRKLNRIYCNPSLVSEKDWKIIDEYLEKRFQQQFKPFNL